VAADAFGYESLFMQALRLREVVLDMFEETNGRPGHPGRVQGGGVRRDIDAETLKGILNRLTTLKSDLEELCAVFMNDYSIKHRLVGVGYLSKEDAYTLGCVGPWPGQADWRWICGSSVLRLQAPGCGADGGIRRRLLCPMPREDSGNVSLHRSHPPGGREDPEGPVDLKIKGAPNGEYFSRIEQPRGK